MRLLSLVLVLICAGVVAADEHLPPTPPPCDCAPVCACDPCPTYEMCVRPVASWPGLVCKPVIRLRLTPVVEHRLRPACPLFPRLRHAL